MGRSLRDSFSFIQPSGETEKINGFQKSETSCPMNGESNGGIGTYPRTYETAHSPFGECKKAVFVAVGSAILNFILIAVIICILSVRARGPPPAPPTCPVVSCPGGWVGYQGKCYYFAKDEGNWTSSKMHCSSLNASLALIDSHEEMNFMMRYKGRADHWLGLQRNLNESSWKWIDGTIFSGWFVVRGGGYCAYMNQEGVASSICSREEPWICSKPVGR